MNFGLSDEQKMLIDTVRRFVSGELRPLEEDVERTGVLEPATARAIFEKSKALGLYAMNIAEEFGGGGLAAVDTMLVEEQFGHTTDILIRRAFGNVYEILLQCDDVQKERWLRPAVTGERTCSLAFTEPEAGSDAAGIKTRATKTANGWSLTGHKHFISDGLFSDFFVVSAVTDPAAGNRGISIFLVDKQLPGVTVGGDQTMMGLRGTSHVEMFFDEVALGPNTLLGKEGGGMRLILATLGRVRLAQIGARAIGKATRILDLAAEHARQRRQFKKPIGDFQMVQQMLADSATEICAARLLLLQTAWKIDQGHDPREHISMVKVLASETLGRVADRAVQIFGGMGYCKNLPIERYFRDARIYRIYDGTSEIHRTVIGRAMMKGDVNLHDVVA
jgi:acyl-CoA dehydrogenase